MLETLLIGAGILIGLGIGEFRKRKLIWRRAPEPEFIDRPETLGSIYEVMGEMGKSLNRLMLSGQVKKCENLRQIVYKHAEACKLLLAVSRRLTKALNPDGEKNANSSN